MFEKNYFVHSKTSNYENYREKKFKFLARDIVATANLTLEDSILDFGCVLPDCEVMTDEGYQQIGEINTGNFLYDNNRVKRRFERDYIGNLIYIKPMFFEGVWFTLEHPILVAKKAGTGKFNKAVFKRADEIICSKDWRRCDYIVIPKIKGEVPFYLNFPKCQSNAATKLGIQALDEDWAGLFGWYLAEGFRAANCVTGFSLGEEPEYAKEILGLGEKKGIHGDITRHTNGIRVRLFSASLIRYLSNTFGSGARRKHLPNGFLSWNKKITENLLDAYINGDGHRRSGDRSGVVSCISASKILIKQIQLILLKLGFPASYCSSIRPAHKIGDRMIPETRAYELEWNTKKRICYEDKDNWYFKVRKIERKYYSGRVHNLETNSEIFRVPFVVHNCATGGLLKEFKDMGFKYLKGTDISYWAIKYGKKNLDLEKELDYYNVNLLANDYDVILLLDVLEHVATWEIDKMLLLINDSSSNPKIIFRVPVAIKEGENYFLEVSRNDVTHIQCHAKEWWQKRFSLHGFQEVRRIVEKSIYDSKGVYAAVFEKEVRK